MPVTVDSLISRIKPHRPIHGIAAALLPFESPGVIAEEAFVAHLRATHACGLTNAVNMDTGYVNLISDIEKRTVLRLAREALGSGVSFVAGAFIAEDGADDDIAGLYHRKIDEIIRFEATPILFQTRRTHGLSPGEKAAVYQEACRDVPGALAFELSNVFAPNGEIWDDETFERILDIPQIIGAKHSSLNRITEMRRLEARDRLRPEFRVYTGNDLGINMIEYGSDYLLGLATFCPEKFADRDQAWEEGRAEYYAISDALQYLGNVAFRSPVPAYKHSAAVYLHAAGRIPTSLTHNRCPQRPGWEAEIMADCADRLHRV